MLQATLLALIAGYADAIGNLDFNAFAGLMTGNTIYLGIELATHRYGEAAFHAFIIFMFLVGVILARVAVRAGLRAWMALLITSLLLAVCSFTNVFWSAVLLALAMGVQNSAATRFNGVALNTVFITGNLQKLGEELVAWAWPKRDTPRRFAPIFGVVWLSYAVGALMGAIASRTVPYPLLIPAVILPFVLIRGGD